MWVIELFQSSFSTHIKSPGINNYVNLFTYLTHNKASRLNNYFHIKQPGLNNNSNLLI